LELFERQPNVSEEHVACIFGNDVKQLFSRALNVGPCGGPACTPRRPTVGQFRALFVIPSLRRLKDNKTFKERRKKESK
jgi:hypothetical protein